MAKIILAVVAAVLVASASAAVLEQVTCQDAVTTLMPCVGYLKGLGDKPTPPCCLGVQKLNGQCALKPDRVKVCQCLKDAATGLGVDQTRAKNLPGLCNVHLPFPISLDIDCNKISM